MPAPAKRILLSVPHMGGLEEGFVKEAFTSNWLSTVGPHLNAFEQEFGERVGRPAVALGSGTAAIHLALRLLGVTSGDEVFVSTLTFVGSVSPIVYLGARPVMIDSERASWGMDPQRLADALAARARVNRLPRAVMVVHLYGQCADLDPIVESCRRYGVPLIEDAAEAVGSLYKGRPAGSFGAIGTYSFNGNKIITTTGGGMLVSENAAWVDKARFWSTQAREPGVPWHEHVELGYNYRLSNVLAAIGRGQLRVLDDRVRQRREIAFRYRDALADVPGVSFMPQASHGLHTNWFSVILLEPERFGMGRDELIGVLDRANIETRPIWKPMHLQPVFAGSECVGGEVASDLFSRGICLPSSSSLTAEEQDWVIETIRNASRAGRRLDPPKHVT